MTRTNKSTVHEKAPEPKYFAHTGHFKTDPNKVSRNGAGNFNWGKPGDELSDEAEFKQLKQGRRNSNHAANELSIESRMNECDKNLNNI